MWWFFQTLLEFVKIVNFGCHFSKTFGDKDQMHAWSLTINIKQLLIWRHPHFTINYKWSNKRHLREFLLEYSSEDPIRCIRFLVLRVFSLYKACFHGFSLCTFLSTFSHNFFADVSFMKKYFWSRLQKYGLSKYQYYSDCDFCRNINVVISKCKKIN